MDEMTQVRELRDGAPTPDRARLVAGREKLLHSAVKRAPRYGAARRRLTVAGAAAAVLVAVLATAQLPDGGDRVAAPPASADGGGTSPSEESRAVLLKAAEAAEALPDPRPRTGQWVYLKRFYGHEDVPGDGEMPDRGAEEDWYPWRALEEGWREKDVFSYRERYVILQELPSEPEKWFAEALKWLPPPKDEKGEKEKRYWVATNLLATPLAPPDGVAKTFRALAELDGMRVLDHQVTDATGEGAIALYLDGGGRVRDELLFDPRTYRLVGFRTVQVKDPKPFPDHPDLPRFEAGDVVWNEVMVQVALVDREGRRP